MSAAVNDLYKRGIPHKKFALTMPDGTYYPDFITTPDKRSLEFLRHFNLTLTSLGSYYSQSF